MGGFRGNTHLHKRIANVPAQVLARVQRIHIHVARLIDGLICSASPIIPSEYIELHLRAEFHFHASRPRFLHRRLEHIAGVALKGRAVRIDDIAEHAAYSAVCGSPGNDGNGGGIRSQKQIAADVRIEAGDGSSVNGDAVFHGPLQLSRHDRDILLCSEHVKICQPYKFNIVFFYKFSDFPIALHSALLPHLLFSCPCCPGIAAWPHLVPVHFTFRLTAAITRPAKSGCARLGLDLNSGCPCVPI